MFKVIGLLALALGSTAFSGEGYDMPVSGSPLSTGPVYVQDGGVNCPRGFVAVYDAGYGRWVCVMEQQPQPN